MLNRVLRHVLLSQLKDFAKSKRLENSIFRSFSRLENSRKWAFSRLENSRKVAFSRLEKLIDDMKTGIMSEEKGSEADAKEKV